MSLKKVSDLQKKLVELNALLPFLNNDLQGFFAELASFVERFTQEGPSSSSQRPLLHLLMTTEWDERLGVLRVLFRNVRELFLRAVQTIPSLIETLALLDDFLGIGTAEEEKKKETPGEKTATSMAENVEEQKAKTSVDEEEDKPEEKEEKEALFDEEYDDKDDDDEAPPAKQPRTD
ncbi:hypothetical protein GPALN_006436 [Globodera pallida]|nr:hypothetical protein GPALN_006436 [Globodera pallida]